MSTLGRSVLALLAAAVAPAALLLAPSAVELAMNRPQDAAAWSRFSKWFVAVMGTSALYVLVLGVPAFLILRWRKCIRWWSSIAAGFVLAGLPIALSLWPGDSTLRSTVSHWNGERMVYTMIDGVATLEGWIRYAESIAAFGAFGAVGGLAGWLVWRRASSGGEQQRDREAVRR